MTITELRQSVEEAQSYADAAAALISEIMRTDSAAVSAQISMAKSLAVIAEILVKNYALKTESEE